MRGPYIGRLQRESRPARSDDSNRRAQLARSIEGEMPGLVNTTTDLVALTLEISHHLEPLETRVDPDTKILQRILNRLGLGAGDQAQADDEKPSHDRTLRCLAEKANRQDEGLHIAGTSHTKRLCSRRERGAGRSDIVYQ